MLRGHKNPEILVTEIQMTRTNNNHSFLIVEGINDSKFWQTRVSEVCDIVDSEGKQNALGCIDHLNMEKFCGALCIVDSDFDRLDGNRLEQNNVIATDAHDLESLICRSSSLRSVLAEFGNAEKIKRFQDKESRDIRAALLERALVFGRLRWAIRADPEMNLREIRVPRFVDETSWSINQEELFRFVAGSSSREKMLKGWMDQLASEDAWHIVRGPDLIEILRIGLKSVLDPSQVQQGVTRFQVYYELVCPLMNLSQQNLELESVIGNP